MFKYVFFIYAFMNYLNIYAEKKRLCFIGDTGHYKSQHQKIVKNILKDKKCTEIFLLGDMIYDDGAVSINDERFMDYEMNFKTGEVTVMPLSESKRPYFDLFENIYQDVFGMCQDK